MGFQIFLVYSFLGYLLERSFAKLTASPRQARKCFLLLPLCPVYGLAMALFLALPRLETLGFFALALRGAAVCTAVEYAVHLFYERVFGVRFWDYSGVRGNVRGRICLPFSAAWGLLSAVAARFLQPLLLPVMAWMAGGVSCALLILLAADAVLSAAVLAQRRDTEALGVKNAVRSVRWRFTGGR